MRLISSRPRCTRRLIRRSRRSGLSFPSFGAFPNKIFVPDAPLETPAEQPETLMRCAAIFYALVSANSREASRARVPPCSQSINQSINIFNVLGGNWDPTDKKFSSVNSYRLPTCKAFPHKSLPIRNPNLPECTAIRISN